MTAAEIHEAVAKATGEDVRTIAWHGFVMLEPMQPSADSSTQAPVAADDSNDSDIDWDDIELERYLAMCG